MEIVGGVKYNSVKEDCPRVLSMALRKKYDYIPELGCMLTDSNLMNKLKIGLKKHGLKKKQIYSSSKNYINKKQIIKLLTHLLENKKDGFFVLEHNNPNETRHLLAFLFNHKHNTLDFFDSYNDSRTFYTLRLRDLNHFIEDVFHEYFKDEFVIEKCFEFNYI